MIYKLTSPYLGEIKEADRKNPARLAALTAQNEGVRKIQRALKQRGYRKIFVDGVYGPVTASTVADWKRYWGGYPESMINGACGGTCWGHLVEGKSLPKKGKVDYAATAAKRRKARADARAAELASKTIMVKAADTMEAWAKAGYKERDCKNTNPQHQCTNFVPELSKLGKELGIAPFYYNMHFPYCAYGVGLAGLVHGSSYSKAGFAGKFNVLYTVDILAKMRSGKFGLKMINRKECSRGCMLMFNFPGGAETDHTGLALGGFDSAGYVRTVECNTSLPGSSGSQSNGGFVAIRKRHISEIVGIAEWS